MKHCVFAAFALVACSVEAADLTLICKAKESLPGGTQTSYVRRFEITEEPRYFKSQVDTGAGFRPSREGRIKQIDDRRIVLQDDADMRAYIDRTTGELYMNIYSQKAIHRGTCEKAKPAATKF